MLVFRLLIWDNWNVIHISRHKVTPDEVEEVCHNEPVVQVGKKGRSLIIGSTLSDRMLTIILDPEPSGEGIYYPVTARPSSRKEKTLYIKEKGGNNK